MLPFINNGGTVISESDSSSDDFEVFGETLDVQYVIEEHYDVKVC